MASNQRKRRCRLADDVSEMSIRRERSDFVQDRLAHGGLHSLALRVVSQLEVLPDFGILHVLQARGAEDGMGEEWCDFEERETAFRERISVARSYPVTRYHWFRHNSNLFVSMLIKQCTGRDIFMPHDFYGLY